jgi:hypothetical protein
VSEPSPSSGEGLIVAPKAETTASALALKGAKGAIGLFGLGGILYGVGFLVLRSHFAMLGVWNGIPSNSGDFAEEGGRFWLALLLVPADVLQRLFQQFFQSREQGDVWAFAIVAAAALVWDRRVWLQTHLRMGRGLAFGAAAARLYAISPVLFLTISLGLTYVLLNTEWVPLASEDVLRTGKSIALLRTDPGYLSDTMVVEFLLALLAAWFLYRVGWPSARRVERVMIFAQWSLVAASLATLPMVYGRLLLPDEYPIFRYGGASPDLRLLVGEAADIWVVWNVNTKETEIVPKQKVTQVSIGARRSVFAANSK